ncbi:MAG: terminase family protein [Anaerolineales bacterium]|nr:terminase family protein [Anaerolineales bacterium]MCW5855297.1 terminase family protein [Anaerolineales bacterium]
MLSQPNTLVSPTDAKRELARRELGRRRLTAATEYLLPWYETQRFHRLIDHALEDAERYVRTRGREGYGRHIVLTPPRYGKSEKVSKVFPAWFLGKNPDMRVILASYGADLAHGNSRAVRDIILSEQYAGIFGQKALVDEPVGLDPDSRAVSGWELAVPHRGGLAAAGVGGPLTGKGAHLMVIDDPYKDREQAESAAYRQKVIDWWSSVAYQRLEDFAAVVLVQTRWHPNDLAGYLMREMLHNPDADQWRVLSLPTVAPEESEYAKDESEQRSALAQGIYLNLKDPLDRQPGEVLWPGKYGPEQVRQIRANTAAHDWLALHMQTPRPRTGGFFAKEWQMVDRAPENLRWFRVWDLATSESAKADYTCGAAIAFDPDGVLYIRDLRRWRAAWPESRRRLVEISGEVPAGEIWGLENVAFQLAAIQDLRAELQSRPIYAVKPEAGKEEMALPLQTLNDLGRVCLVRGPWNRDFVEEASVFPRPGEKDDQIDTITKGMQLAREYEKKHGISGAKLVGFA